MSSIHEKLARTAAQLDVLDEQEWIALVHDIEADWGVFTPEEREEFRREFDVLALKRRIACLAEVEVRSLRDTLPCVVGYRVH